MPAEPDAAAVRSRVAAWIEWLPFFLLPCATLLFQSSLPAWAFMWLLAFTLFCGLKWQSWWSARSVVPHPFWRSIAYLALWPGMDACAFLDPQRHAPRPSARQWAMPCVNLVTGTVLFFLLARQVSPAHPILRGWTGMLGLILMLHFGSFAILGRMWQRIGIDAPLIMASPLRSTSLSEFWGKRWNLGFRQLAHELIFRPLKRRAGASLAGFAVFLASGLIHDLVISLPAHGGYGLPTLYFVLQGLGVLAERSTPGRAVGLRGGWRGWLFMAIVTATPAFFLFHPPFVTRVILPFMQAVHAL